MVSEKGWAWYTLHLLPLFCRKCSNHWGIFLLFTEQLIPCCKIRQFTKDTTHRVTQYKNKQFSQYFVFNRNEIHSSIVIRWQLFQEWPNSISLPLDKLCIGTISFKDSSLNLWNFRNIGLYFYCKRPNMVKKNPTPTKTHHQPKNTTHHQNTSSESHIKNKHRQKKNNHKKGQYVPFKSR